MSALSTNAAIPAFTAAIGTTCPNTPPTPNNSYGTLEMAIHLGNGKGGTIALDGITFTTNNVTSATNTVTRATSAPPGWEWKSSIARWRRASGACRLGGNRPHP